MSTDAISNISGISSRPVEVTGLTSKVNEQETDKSFFSVLKEVGSKETFLITAKFGHVNTGGQVNHLNSAEDVVNVLNNNQYTLVVQNEDLPAHLKEGIKAVTGGSISSVA